MDKTCAACRHYEASGAMAQLCEAPGAKAAAHLVIGPREDIIHMPGAFGIQALYARYCEGLCGIEGKWWEAKIDPLKEAEAVSELIAKAKTA